MAGMNGINNGINIEEIMDEIRREIREKGYTDDMPSFENIENGEASDYQYSEVEFRNLLLEINEKNNILWYRDLEGGFLARLLKKVVRKLASFLGVPIVLEQSAFNGMTARAFDQLAGYIKTQEEELEKSRQEINLLEEKIETLRKQLNENGDHSEK